MTLEFLLRAWHAVVTPRRCGWWTVTLDAMANGGINDQLGGGFARYSTDADWLVPHFEKMLYDNAQLAHAYLEAYRATGEERHRAVVESTLDFVLRELAHAAMAALRRRSTPTATARRDASTSGPMASSARS